MREVREGLGEESGQGSEPGSGEASSEPAPVRGSAIYHLTTARELLGWARKNALTHFPFATGCCSIEYEAALGPGHDLDRLGAGIPTTSPARADLLLVAGTVTHRSADLVKQIYREMARPRWVMAIGGCACTGGPYDTYATLQGVDRIVDVDIYIPGCPPRPEALLDGLIRLQDLVERTSAR
jgi:NADH-quinone oxidoreductase subunit B